MNGTQWEVDKAPKLTLNVTMGNISVVQYSAIDAKLFKPKSRAKLASKSAAVSSGGSRSNDVGAKGLYDFTAEEDEELTFKAGDMMKIIEQDPEWWVAEIRGKKGFVPANYVEIVQSPGLERV